MVYVLWAFSPTGEGQGDSDLRRFVWGIMSVHRVSMQVVSSAADTTFVTRGHWEVADIVAYRPDNSTV